MYHIGNIVTPHPTNNSEMPSQPFFDAAHIFDATARDNEPEIMAFADNVEAQLAASLRPLRPSRSKPPLVDSLQTMMLEQYADNLGYTVAHSEALALGGINHYVGYADRRFFVALTYRSATGEDRLDARDVLNQSFGGDISDDIYQTMSGTRRATAEDIKNGFADQPNQHQNVILNTDAARRQRFARIVGLYPHKLGRDMLEHYASLEFALKTDNITLAIDQALALNGRFPENDSRVKHPLARALIGKVCLSQGYSDQIDQLIDSYCSSIRTGSPSILGLRGDLFRIAAQKTGDRAAALRAIDYYEEAINLSRWEGFKAASLGKIRSLAKSTIIA